LSVKPSQPNKSIFDSEFSCNLSKYSLLLNEPINAIKPGTAHSPPIIFSSDNRDFAKSATAVEIALSGIVKQ